MKENNNRAPILEVRHLKMYFPIRKGLIPKTVGEVKSVDDVSFEVGGGETFGLVGESGCGKTTTGKCILRVFRATDGEVLFKGNDVLKMPDSEYKQIKRKIQMIFQDPYGSLDPRQSAFSIVKEMLMGDGVKRSKSEAREEVERLMRMVGLPVELGSRYPHEMSGGQRQRLGIARALACHPDLIICDEPVSALDVSIQAQVINLFKKLQKELGLSYIFVAHDLAVVRHIVDRIGVMYLGHIVELGSSEEICQNPVHPYTKALLSAIPGTDYDKEQVRERIVLEGEVPSPLHAPKGCPFSPRCPYATEECRQSMPAMRKQSDGHFVACFHDNSEREDG